MLLEAMKFNTFQNKTILCEKYEYPIGRCALYKQDPLNDTILTKLVLSGLTPVVYCSSYIKL